MDYRSILDFFGTEEKDIRSYSPLTLAFIGDSVYELIIRSMVVGEGNTSPAKLQKKATSFEKAAAQALMLKRAEDGLSEEEAEYVRRGKNAKPHTMAKNATTAEYMSATGFETLIGYLYMTGKEDRIMELIRQGTGSDKDA